MKNWKKIIIASILMVAVLFSTTTFVEAAPKVKGYTFKYNGVTVAPHGEAKDLIKKAGKVQKKTKSKSCAYDGEDITYQYKDFKLITYTNKKGGTEYVQSIDFKTKKVTTDQGIKIGSKKSAVTKKYANGKFNKISGVYTCTKGKTTIQFTIKNDKVTAIKYIAEI